VLPYFPKVSSLCLEKNLQFIYVIKPYNNRQDLHSLTFLDETGSPESKQQIVTGE
jgi:hypothetical protein